MLRGKFDDTTGRPFIEGQLWIPSVGIVDEEISLLTDTGADSSILSPVDSAKMHLDHALCTPNDEPVGGVGGRVKGTYRDTAVLAFSDEDGQTTYGYVIDLLILPKTKDTERLVSVVGRDILDQWRMDYWPIANSLTFQVERADYVVAYDPRGEAVSVAPLQ